MDYEQDSEQMEPVTGPGRVVRKKGKGWRIFWGIFTGMSVVGNILLLFLLVAVVGLLVIGQRDLFVEEIIEAGPKTAKIVVVNLRGIIDAEKSRDVLKQLNKARGDEYVRGLIVRIHSPGGGVSASDQIHNAIRVYREKTGVPVVAFMEGLAASGGYYASVGCEKIVAEPTTITGSIGVIMGYFVLQELLEDKLGIKPVILKSGEKKDWPSSFRAPSEEEQEYLERKVLQPAYERFVELVDAGREELTLAEVRLLSDGSIYGAREALEEKLIDEIGYLADAVKLVKSMAGISVARVVEYERPFSLSSLLGSRKSNLLHFNRTSLYELHTPEVLYLWSGY